MAAGSGVTDRGVFEDLNERVRLALPATLSAARAHAVLDRVRGVLVLYDGAQPVKAYPEHTSLPSELRLGKQTLHLRAADAAELRPLLSESHLQVRVSDADSAAGSGADQDRDGIPDALDVLLGAHKTVLNEARYDPTYVELSYPLGDVPRQIGVCTDVIIRALRNAGFDLQRAVHEDVVRAPRAYPMVKRPNASIDHRRVKSLLPYFQRHFEPHTAKLDDPPDPFLPGDIVLMDTFPGQRGAEHIGLVSEERDAQGLPRIINHWTFGYPVRPMELLSSVPVTHRFRLPSCPSEHSPISAQVKQLVVVTVADFDSSRGQLQRYARASGGRAFEPVGPRSDVVWARGGLAWAPGLHGTTAPAGRPGPVKRSADGRLPAGVFAAPSDLATQLEMDAGSRDSLRGWLRPGAVWVSLPLAEYRALQFCWGLPSAH